VEHCWVAVTEQNPRATSEFGVWQRLPTLASVPSAVACTMASRTICSRVSEPFSDHGVPVPTCALPGAAASNAASTRRRLQARLILMTSIDFDMDCLLDGMPLGRRETSSPKRLEERAYGTPS
jgi:hypothetical protein